MSDDAKYVDCTCRASEPARYNPGLLHYPCPVHGYVYATEHERIELLEERVKLLEECVLELEKREPTP